MENLPGAFPGYGSNNNLNYSEINSTRYSNLNEISSEIKAREKSLKSRKRTFKQDLLYKIDGLCFMYYIICYLYDCSLLNLLIRSLIQIIMISQHSPVLKNYLSHYSNIRIIFQLLIIINIMVISSHILKQELPIANDDGFIYGHHTLQIIGEQQLNNKISLIGYDLILFYLQLIVYAIQYSSKREKSTSKAEFLNINDDGYQGETLAIRIPLINVINIPLVSIEELKSEQELNDESNGTRFNSQIDTLLNGDTIPYGSIDNNL